MVNSFDFDIYWVYKEKILSRTKIKDFPLHFFCLLAMKGGKVFVREKFCFSFYLLMNNGPESVIVALLALRR